VNDSAAQAVLELDPSAIGQCAFPTTDDNQAEEQMAFVDRAARGH
jgi:hypothetical protein